jgi:hypothetical protein
MQAGDGRHGERAPSESVLDAARILDARAPATDAEGIPPLDSDQVLDLQRSAGNRLTAAALARWTDPPAD